MFRASTRWPSGSLIALCAAAPAPRHARDVAVALCAGLPLADPSTGSGAPEWVHLLPAGTIATMDGRGPYRVADAAELARVSLQAGEKLPLDENHSTDLAAPRGEPAPARGWIVELQARQDGIWGRVDWTPIGARLVAQRAYRAISPVIEHTADGTVRAILRASLVNKPNLRGLAALHQENTMDLLAKLIAALGLPATTTEDEVAAKITAMHAERTQAGTALQSALSPIATAVGLQAGADAAAVLAGVQALKTGAAAGDQAVITALQAELRDVTTRLNALTEGGKKQAAETFVDGAIRAGRVGVKPMRDRYVTMHMADPAGTEALIAAMPVLGGGGQIVPATPPARDGEIALNAEQLQAAKLLGLDPKTYADTLKAERTAAL